MATKIMSFTSFIKEGKVDPTKAQEEPSRLRNKRRRDKDEEDERYRKDRRPNVRSSSANKYSTPDIGDHENFHDDEYVDNITLESRRFNRSMRRR
jgi:hypothetical protein